MLSKEEDFVVPFVIGEGRIVPFAFLLRSKWALLSGPKLNEIILGVCGDFSSYDVFVEEFNILLDDSNILLDVFFSDDLLSEL